MDNDFQLTVRRKTTPDASNRPLERIGKGEEITIREKSGIIFTFKDQMKVSLFWKAAKSVERTARDLDLCLFYRSTDGRLGGVFSEEYREFLDDLGSLDRFPYILHNGDRILSTLTRDAFEKIESVKLDEIESACICVVDYEAALNGLPALFDDARAYVEFSTPEGDNHRCNLKSPDRGAVYWVAPLAKARMDSNASNACAKSCRLLKRQSRSPVSNSSAKPRRKAVLSDNRPTFCRP